tara:strand:- start:4089 stop:4553 length:465 start_codon:yes stop_codon:yes gene_type:complete
VNTQNTEVLEKSMADVPEHEISALRALSGYEQMLGMDRISKQYGITEAELLARLQPAGHGQQQGAPIVSGNQGVNAAPFIPDVKEAPALPSSATLLDKSNFRFEYDPSQEAAERRSAVAQAILCPGCGVALGIPDIRPIKVTCPQCLQETMFDV